MRRTSTVIVLILILGILFYGYRERDIDDAAKTPPTSNNVPPDPSPKKSGDIDESPALGATRVPASVVDGAEIEGLRQRLAEEEQRLTSLQYDFAALEARKAQEEQRTSMFSSSRLAANNGRIQNLLEFLQSQRLSENDIDRAADNARRDQVLASEASRDQIDESIRALERSLRQTMEQLDFWTRNTYDLTAREIRLTELQEIFTAQQQALDALREQRAGIATDLLQVTRGIAGAADQRKAELLETQASIQEEILNLREENNRIQSEGVQARMSLMSLNQRLTQAQRARDEQLALVNRLESELNLKTSPR